jgi:hypothetical protein
VGVGSGEGAEGKGKGKLTEGRGCVVALGMDAPSVRPFWAVIVGPV